MAKYTNFTGKYVRTWLENQRNTDPNNHECANDGTCGQSITKVKFINREIFFYDSNEKEIARMPLLLQSNHTYHNYLYKPAQSKNFGENTEGLVIQNVLPNQFNFEYGKLNCIIHYDNLSQQEQEQMKLDIQNAYEAYKAKFCINSDIQITVDTYIFNNRDDYIKYGKLSPLRATQSQFESSYAMTEGRNVTIFKHLDGDNSLAHEFGHVFQRKFSRPQVKALEYRHSELMSHAMGIEVEEKNSKAISKKFGLDEYKDSGSKLQLKYGDTTALIRYKDLSAEEKFQVIERFKNSGIDSYEGLESMFNFKYKGTTYYVYHGDVSPKDISEEEKFQLIQDIKNSHGSLVSKCDGLGNENTTLRISLDGKKEISKIYFHNPDKNTSTWLDKTIISISQPEQDVDNTDPKPGKEPETAKEQKGDEYTESTGVLQFKYKGTNYSIQHKGYLSAEKEKLQFIKDIQNSHESLISKIDGLNEGPLSKNLTVVIVVDENKEISKIYFHNPDKNTSTWLDKTIISISQPEQDVDNTDPKPGKEPETESAEEDTQQPSSFLSNIFSTIKSIIDSISSLFLWLFGSEEEEQSDNNLSLLDLSEEQSDDNLSLLKPHVDQSNHDADENYVGNYSLYNNNDYYQHDDLIS